MKHRMNLLAGLVMLLVVTACTAAPGETRPVIPTVMDTSTEKTASAHVVDIESTAMSAAGQPAGLSGIQAQVDYEIRQPASLPDGYVLENVTLHGQTRSVCLQYRHPDEQDSVLFIAQGPVELAPPLEKITGWPDYSVYNEPEEIGGAEKGQRVSGWRRADWACTNEAENEKTPYSFTLAPRYSWVDGTLQFDLFSASRGCRFPGGLTRLDLIQLAEDLTGESTHPADELDPECLLSVADVETLTGMDIREPTALPENMAFYYATYEKETDASVILHYYHEQHPDMGDFFRISMDGDPFPFALSTCDDSTAEVCEVIPDGTSAIVYQYYNPTEQLDWEMDGVFYSLFRNAGEPGKIYKEELLGVINSMK